MDRVLLLGCVSQKEITARPARELYRSSLFRARRGYAETSRCRWFVLSALHGVVSPEEIIEPYDATLNGLPGTERAVWGARVAGQLEDRLGELRGRVFEVHAGETYMAAIRQPLTQRGARLEWPLRGLRIGEQLGWYAAQQKPGTRVAAPTRLSEPEPAPESAPGRGGSGLARRVTDAFVAGRLDLSARPGAPKVGWLGMPEVAATRRLRSLGASGADIRCFITLTAAMDRARDADALWEASANLFLERPDIFDPSVAGDMGIEALGSVLRAARVSQRHTRDRDAWKRISASLAGEASPAVTRAVSAGVGSAVELSRALQTRWRGQAAFPFLRGPKIGPMWLRMLAYPGGGEIEALDAVPVAVDVQVRKVTEYLGMTATRGQPLREVRGEIQRAWARDIRGRGAIGPVGLENTCAALDPALWFYAKWGCTRCERAGARLPIAETCAGCLFDSLAGMPRAAC